jgi:hypothetical protein
MAAQEKNTITETDSIRLGPSTETSASAQRRKGTDMTRSISRLSARSTQPPKNPAVVPTITAMAEAQQAASTPTSKDTRAP